MEESRIPIKLTNNPEGATKNRKTKKAVSRGCRRGFEEDGRQGLEKKRKGEKRRYYGGQGPAKTVAPGETVSE
jgi:hypothetical protein